MTSVINVQRVLLTFKDILGCKWKQGWDSLLIGHFLNGTHSLGAILKSSGLWGHGVTKRVCLSLVLRTHTSIGFVNCIPKVYYSVRDIIKILQIAKQQNQVSYNSGVWNPRKIVEGVWFFPWFPCFQQMAELLLCQLTAFPRGHSWCLFPHGPLRCTI